jgi:hypothetical protein
VGVSFTSGRRWKIRGGGHLAQEIRAGGIDAKQIGLQDIARDLHGWRIVMHRHADNALFKERLIALPQLRDGSTGQQRLHALRPRRRPQHRRLVACLG